MSESPLSIWEERKPNIPQSWCQRLWRGAAHMMQGDNQVPYPLIQIQGALAVRNKGESGGPGRE